MAVSTLPCCIHCLANDSHFTHPYANATALCNAINAIAGIKIMPTYGIPTGVNWYTALNGALFGCESDTVDGYTQEYWFVYRLF